tara:strand:- start:395 stop:586 length:192 start_codon:yes stop_codon:yes gene_type:complete
MSINEMTDKYRVTYLSVEAQNRIQNNMKSLVRRLDRAYDWVQQNIGNDALEFFIAYVEGDEEE